MKHWNKIRNRFIKDAISVILILLHEKVVEFCLKVFLINSRFSNVKGGSAPPPQSLKKGALRPQATPPPISTDWRDSNSKAQRTLVQVARTLVICDQLRATRILVCGENIQDFCHSCHEQQIPNMFNIFGHSCVPQLFAAKKSQTPFSVKQGFF